MMGQNDDTGGAELEVLNSAMQLSYPINTRVNTCREVVDKRIGNGSTQQARLSDADTSKAYQVPIADQKCSQLPGTCIYRHL
jgi:hypothetical protein